MADSADIASTRALVGAPGVLKLPHSLTNGTGDPEVFMTAKSTMNPIESVSAIETQSNHDVPNRPIPTQPLAVITPVEPSTPQLLPSKDLSTPDTPTPLSRSSSVRGIAPSSTAGQQSAHSEKQTAPAKGHSSRFFPNLLSLAGWRSKTAKEPAEPTSSQAESKPHLPLLDRTFFQRCPACKTPNDACSTLPGGKKPHTCSAGMDIDECRAERRKRRREKAEAGAELAGTAAAPEEVPMIVIDEEGPVHRPAHLPEVAPEHRIETERTDQDHSAVAKEAQEWQVL